MDFASGLDDGPPMPARWSLRLLGGVELTVLARGDRITSLGKRERALLAYLALSSRGREQRSKLAALLWCDSDKAPDSLRTCLWRLRKALDDNAHQILASVGEDIVLDVSAFEVDAIVFRRLVAQSGRTELETAAKLYCADFLDGLAIESEEFESWRRSEATRYRDEVIDALIRLMMLLEAGGEPANAIEVGNRILRIEPMHEAVVRRLMQLYGESGRRGAAVQLYRAHDDALRTELNAKPEPETREVLAELANRGGERRARQDDADQSAGVPQGSDDVRRDSNLPIQTSIRQKTRWLTGGLAGCLVIVTALVLFQATVVPPHAPVAQTALLHAPTGLPPQMASDATPIAVLPFANLSGDASQDVFADGTSQEIASALAKLPGLEVVGRSSASRFKGSRDLRAIGRSLKASYLLDGSVLIAGNHVRVTAQLVHAEDGITLWTNSYDRELADIFAIQADITRAVARALQTPLGPQQNNASVVRREIDIRTYEDYLRAKALLRGRLVGDGLPEVVRLLETVVERSPNFAPAWASLATVYDLMPIYSTASLRGSREEIHRLRNQYAGKAEEAAQRAVRMDPGLAEGYIALAFLAMSRRDVTEAFDQISRALSLDPTNADVLAAYRNVLLEVGRVAESLGAQQRVVALEPFVPRFRANLATNLWLVGQDDAAIEILTHSPASDDGAATGKLRLGMIYAAMGDYGEAADTLMSMPSTAFPQAAVKTAVRFLRAAPSAVVSDHLPQLGALGFVYLHVGEPSRVLEFYEASIESGYLGIAPLWHEAYAPVRRTERFKRLVERARLPEFWRARGWPVFCHPLGARDFACG